MLQGRQWGRLCDGFLLRALWYSQVLTSRAEVPLFPSHPFFSALPEHVDRCAWALGTSCPLPVLPSALATSGLMCHGGA